MNREAYLISGFPCSKKLHGGVDLLGGSAGWAMSHRPRGLRRRQGRRLWRERLQGSAWRPCRSGGVNRFTRFTLTARIPGRMLSLKREESSRQPVQGAQWLLRGTTGESGCAQPGQVGGR